MKLFSWLFFGFKIRRASCFLCFVLLSRSAAGQTSSLSLSSGAAIQGGTVSLNLSLNVTPGTEPAASQWTVLYPAGDVSAANISAGPALTAAGKTLSCASNSGSLVCLALGLHPHTDAPGRVALV